MKVNTPHLRLFFLILLTSIVSMPFSRAQQLIYRQGEILINVERGINPASIIENISSSFENIPLDAHQITVAPLNIYKVKFDHSAINAYHLLDRLRGHNDIKIAQFNHIIKHRNTPNDSLYDNQWQYNNIGQSGGILDADIDADLAWDITTGGVTAGGDTIVVCVIDGGLDNSHLDFEDNIWKNRMEIPGNGIDDDGNGYIDDYKGWDIFRENDDVLGISAHGTSVAGIIGAKGNNGIGVTGVNWDVKLMILKGGGDEAEAIAGYSYAYTMRKMYNESNGEKGAFIVATNSSWGTDLGKAEDAPIWCNFYNLMGEIGILSVGATTNRNENVDIVGDLPTTCPSDYLISVSNLNHFGSKVNNAGYGNKNIDLGAFGENVYTTSQGNSYRNFGGTSAAAPHVAGTIALAYAVQCQDIVQFYRNDPAGAALLIKSSILNGAKTSQELSGLFATGGSLNAFNTVNIIQNYCGTCPFPFNVNVDSIALDAATINWEANEAISFFNLRYKLTDDTEWDTLSEVSAPVTIQDLLLCSSYEIQIQSVCDIDSTSEYSASKTFVTLGCCENPDVVTFNNKPDQVSEGALLFEWLDDPDYESYIFEYKLPEDTIWTTINTEESNVLIDGIGFCQLVEARLSAVCITGITTGTSEIISAVTGCDNCTVLDYCPQPKMDSEGEWIEAIQIGDFKVTTGNNGGNADFSGFYNVRIPMKETILFGVEKGFGESEFFQHIAAWIDFNMDGIFQDSELIYAENGASVNDIMTTLYLNNDYQEGYTKMRIAQVYADNVAFACLEDSPASFGEYEDYCVYLFERQVCDTGITIDSIYVLDTEATVVFSTLDTAIAYNVRFKKVEESDDDWNTISVLDTIALMAPLDECSEYVVQIRAVCPIDTSGFEMVSDTFMTTGAACMVNTIDLEGAPPVSIMAFPNPFDQMLNLRIESIGSEEINLQVFNLSGQRVYTRREYIHSGSSNIIISEANVWPPGVYFIRLLSNNIDVTQKIIKAGR